MVRIMPSVVDEPTHQRSGAGIKREYAPAQRESIFLRLLLTRYSSNVYRLRSPRAMCEVGALV